MSQIVFACHSKACAPPPAGRGGSLGGTSGGGGSRVRREYESILNQGSGFHGDNPHGQATIVKLSKGRVSHKWEVSKRSTKGEWSQKKGYSLERSGAVQKALDAFLSSN